MMQLTWEMLFCMLTSSATRFVSSGEKLLAFKKKGNKRSDIAVVPPLHHVEKYCLFWFLYALFVAAGPSQFEGSGGRGTLYIKFCVQELFEIFF